MFPQEHLLTISTASWVFGIAKCSCRNIVENSRIVGCDSKRYFSAKLPLQSYRDPPLCIVDSKRRPNYELKIPLFTVFVRAGVRSPRLLFGIRGWGVEAPT